MTPEEAAEYALSLAALSQVQQQTAESGKDGKK